MGIQLGPLVYRESIATNNAWIRSANSISLSGGGKLNVVVRRIQGSSSCLAVNRVCLSLDNDPVGI
jgi:hypothetical protein